MKLESSPTNILFETIRCNKFLIRQIITPLTGPNAKVPINAGRSEKSNLMKSGMIIGSGISKYIKINAIAESIAVIVVKRTP